MKITATSSTQTYILKCSRLFQILNSEDPIKVIEDPRIKELEDINNWFKIWQNTVKTQYLEFAMKFGAYSIHLQNGTVFLLYFAKF
jgi:hypothetical protein